MREITPNPGPSGYNTRLPGGSHWSLILRRGTRLRITDPAGGANLALLMYNPISLGEKYNAPDTLKCQHTFKLTRGHCLYSDMGRIFCSITEDSFGWHDTIAGTCHKSDVARRWGERDYQTQRNEWLQNGQDSFLVELAKYGLGLRDLAANVNCFSEVRADERGQLSLTRQSQAGDYLCLRFEMDTLVVMHSCPHRLNSAARYPRLGVNLALDLAPPMAEDDLCLNHCAENRRGFDNNALYHFGLPASGLVSQ
ncbi:MAG: urea carboxylase-associated family protein [Marinagarivorans sp.]